MEYEVKITPYALQQMQEIVRYISATLQSPENAARWLDTIKAELASLSSMPARIPLTEEEPWHSKGIRKFLVKGFFIYYIVAEEAQTVSVISVVYGKQNQIAALKQTDI